MLVLLASLHVVGDPAATPTANGVLAVAGVLSMHHLGSFQSYCFYWSLCCLLQLLASIIFLACLLLFFCVQLIGCLICCFHSESLCLFCAGVQELLLKAAFCCRLYCSWLKNNIGKITQDADPPPLTLREGRHVEII